MLNLLIPFFTGLSTGGLTCFALQGGLFSSLILKVDGNAKTKAYVIFSFLLAKLVSYSALGFLLGLAGEVFTPTIKASAFVNMGAAIFMAGVALESFNIHPVFRYFMIQPPKFARKFIRKNAEGGVLAGGLLGAATILIPCGTTQAMMALAISSQNPIAGMLTMATFTLGTIPIFLFFGFTTAKISQTRAQVVKKIVAVVILTLAGYTFVYSLRLLGINPLSVIPYKNQSSESLILSNTSNTESQIVQIELTDRGYIPASATVRSGVPVELTVVNNQAWGCIQSFVIPSLNIRRSIPPGETTTIIFTPEKSGKIGFTCSMGMYYGELIVK